MAVRQNLVVTVAIGSFAIAAVVACLVGWNILFTRHYLLLSERAVETPGAGYWILLSVGDVLLVWAVAALGIFMVGNIRQMLLVRRQNTFIDGVTHELKSPLASLRLALDTLERHDRMDPATVETFLGTMRHDVDRLQLFIEHILEAGRVEHSERAIAPEPVDVEAAVRRVVAQVSRRHRLGDGDWVEVRVPELLEPFHTDPVVFEIVLMNLLDNAAKYAGSERPRAEVDARHANGELVVEVRDHGIGISSAEIGRVFDRFYRIERDDVPRAKGTGLGLFVARAMARRLKGDLSAQSAGKGQGSVFRLRIPEPR